MQYQWSVHTVLLFTFQMNIFESRCWVVRCSPLTIQLQLNLRFMVDEQALKQIFSHRSCQFSLSVHESSIFPCSCITVPFDVWLHWPGRALSPPQLLSFGLHLLMTLCYSHTSLFDFSFIIMLPQKIFRSISMNCLICIIMMKLQ